MKKRYRILVVFAVSIIGLKAVSPGKSIRAGAQAVIDAGKKTAKVTGDFFHYSWKSIAEGVDSTRTLNAILARKREVEKLTMGSVAFEQRKQELNGPPQTTSELAQTLYIGNINQQAQVRTSPGLGQEETRFIYQRSQYIASQLPRVLGQDILDPFKKPIKKTKSKLFSDIEPLPVRFPTYKIPRVAICASGGGDRAKIATAGFLKGMEETGLIDITLFMSGLSGSTWVMAPRALGQPLDALIDSYHKYAKLKLQRSFKEFEEKHPQMKVHSKPTKDCLYAEREDINNNIARKFYWGQPIDAMDFYGFFLAHVSLASFDDPEIINKYPHSSGSTPLVESRQRVLFSQAILNLESNDFGSFPLPIATAVSPLHGLFTPSKQHATKSKMAWFEFTPYEMGTVYYGKDDRKKIASIPMHAMGRKFEAKFEKVFREEQPKSIWGRIKRFAEDTFMPEKRFVGCFSVNNPSELPLGNLLATWGSAFTITIKDAVRIIGYDSLLSGPDPTSKDSIIKTLVGIVVAIFTPIPTISVGAFSLAFKNFRILPSTIHNFMEQLPDSPFTNRTLTLVDAGIDYNLPFPPLLRPERAVDVIIVIDASSPILEKKGGKLHVGALSLAQEWARAQNLPFPTLVGTAEYEKATEMSEPDRLAQAVTVFKGKTGEPTIIYVPTMDNEFNKDSNFSVKKCLESDCSTISFGYSDENIDGLVNHMKNTVVESADLIKETIREVAFAKLGYEPKQHKQEIEEQEPHKLLPPKNLNNVDVQDTHQPVLPSKKIPMQDNRDLLLEKAKLLLQPEVAGAA